MTHFSTPEEIAQYCFQQITAQQKRPLLVAVTGDSGSGKSYYSNLIRKQFDTHSIEYAYVDHDTFLISRAARIPLKEKFYTEGEFQGKSHWEILENWFRLDEYEKVIADLQAGKSTSYFPYKRVLGDLDSTKITIEPKDIILFDTTMMVDKMDLVILVDVTQENIIHRKLERDKDLRTPEQIIDMHKRVQGYCWERVKPQHANIVIDNNHFDRPFIVKNSSL